MRGAVGIGLLSACGMTVSVSSSTLTWERRAIPVPSVISSRAGSDAMAELLETIEAYRRQHTGGESGISHLPVQEAVASWLSRHSRRASENLWAPVLL